MHRVDLIIRTDRRPLPLCPRSGFALLITITLLALLVLLTVSFSALTRVETQVAGNFQQLETARLNALFALNLAIGELQSKAGPDQRITAPSSLGEGQGAAGGEAPGVDARHPFLVGVWKNSPPPSGPVSSRAYAPEFLGWLISGNESKAVTDDDYATPAKMSSTLALPENDPTSIWLVGSQSVEFTGPPTADNPDPRIRLPKQKIQSTSVPGLPGSPTIGHYAWWIGDEGIKARTNICDPFLPGLPQTDETRRLMSAQLFRIDRMDGLASFAETLGTRVQDRILAHEQFLFGISEDVLPAPVQEMLRRRHFHTTTVHSKGLLTDTLNGGLRRDLTHLFSLSQNQMQAALRDSVFKDISATPAAATGVLNGNQLLRPGITVPSWIPSHAEISTGPTWEQLRSFYQFNATGAMSARPHTATQHGVHPLVIHFKMGVGLRRENTAAGEPTDLYAHFRPVVVLANPYSVDLAAEDYLVFFRTGGRFGITDAENTTEGRLVPRAAIFHSIAFRLRSGGIPAGKAHVFTLQPVAAEIPFEAYPWEDGRIYDLVDSYDENASISYLVPGGSFADEEAKVARLRNRSTGSVNVLLTTAVPTGSADILHFLGGGLCNDNTVFTATLDSDADVRWGGGLHQRILAVPSRQTSQGNAAAPLADVNLRALATNRPVDLNDARFPIIHQGINQLASADSFNSLSPASFLALDTDDRATAWLLNDLPAGRSFERNVLFDIPRASASIVSLGHLQHMNPGGFLGSNYAFSPSFPTTFTTPAYDSADAADPYVPSYTIGNARASQFVAREDVIQNLTGALYRRDLSWLLNTLLFDRFFFSTVPQSGTFDFSSSSLANARHIPIGHSLKIADLRSSPTSAAAQLVTNGAFNINSTSVEAWKAFLSATLSVSHPAEAGEPHNAAWPRSLHQPLGSQDADTGLAAEAWAGFRKLDGDDINLLARAIVREVRARGPFLSIADFVNRRLVPNTHDNASTGLSGTLEAAIETARAGSTVRHKLHAGALVENLSLNNRFTRDVGSNAQGTTDADLASQQWVSGSRPNTVDYDHIPRHYAQGFPGWLSQADLLQPLAPTIAARSDTFLIRTYGDTINPATGDVEGRAWCEAIVQRTPDFVDAQPADTSLFGNPALNSTNQTFGRKFVVTHFRWLSAEEI